MTKLDSLYDEIMSMKPNNVEDIIKRIVFNEMDIIKRYTNDLTGMCKIVANNIKYELQKEGIKSKIIDLNRMLCVDHIFLITDTTPSYIIDPTYIQFVKQDNLELIGFNAWPSEKLDPNLLDELLTNYMIEKTESNYYRYLDSFCNTNHLIYDDNGLKISKGQK